MFDFLKKPEFVGSYSIDLLDEYGEFITIASYFLYKRGNRRYYKYQGGFGGGTGSTKLDYWVQTGVVPNTVSFRGPNETPWTYGEARDNFEKQRQKSKEESEKSLNDTILHIMPAILKHCHPDKHGNSEASKQLTQILLEIREKLNGK